MKNDMSIQVSLLRLQATSACNLDCSYCYIPRNIRRSKNAMSMPILDKTMQRLLEEELLGRRLAISWHGAEPLVPGIAWYEKAFETIDRRIGNDLECRHLFQSNGVLLNDDWCEFIKSRKASIGISIDGTIDQNSSRVNWAGRPAFSATMNAIDKLNQNEVPWTMLSVVGRAAMEDPDSFIDFVRESGCSFLGIKIEECNVAHKIRQNIELETENLFEKFIKKLWYAQETSYFPIIREFEQYKKIRQCSSVQTIPVTILPLRNLTVDTKGNFTIFSGELLFHQHESFVFGNVMRDELRRSLLSDKFVNISDSIRNGVKKCASTCSYFRECGGFYISQKFSEHGSFDSGETNTCRLEIKAIFRTLDSIRN